MILLIWESFTTYSSKNSKNGKLFSKLCYLNKKNILKFDFIFSELGGSELGIKLRGKLAKTLKGFV